MPNYFETLFTNPENAFNCDEPGHHHGNLPTPPETPEACGEQEENDEDDQLWEQIPQRFRVSTTDMAKARIMEIRNSHPKSHCNRCSTDVLGLPSS